MLEVALNPLLHVSKNRVDESFSVFFREEVYLQAALVLHEDVANQTSDVVVTSEMASTIVSR